MYYDYVKQVWVKDGKYQRCGHLDSMDCKCYGKEHEGEEVESNNLVNKTI